MGDGSVYTDTLYVNGSKTEKNPKYIRKAYLRFDGGAYQHTQKATLCLNVEEANGQTIKLWGVKDANYPAELTYNTAPASDADESMLSAEVYGGVPIAQIKAEHAGQYEIDVTGFIADNAPNDYIFALTSETSAEQSILVSILKHIRSWRERTTRPLADSAAACGGRKVRLS